MTDRTCCYALEAVSSTVPLRNEFSQEPMRAWLTEFRSLKLERAVPQLIIKLDRLSKVAMSAVGRRNLLHELERPLLRTVAALPKVNEDVRDTEQGGSGEENGAKMEKRKRWTTRNLFRFLGFQVELSLFRGQPMPCETWRELHDLYAYTVARGIVSAVGRSRRQGRRDDFDPERDYKRLLLLGLAGRLVRNKPWSDLVQEKIDSWVADTSLQNPVAFVGETDLYVVDTSADSAPHQLQSPLPESFRGWVLMRPAGFLTDAAASREVENLDPARGQGIGLRA